MSNVACEISRAFRQRYPFKDSAIALPDSVCSTMSSVQDTKVDITYLSVEGDNNRTVFLLCLNFNIPHHSQTNQAQFQQILSDLSRFLSHHFLPDNQVTFQVTAAYYLKNRNTDEERLWTGSFFPGNRVSLSGPYFQVFDPQNFQRKLQSYTSPQNVQRNLVWNHLPTEWNFLGLASFIVNCQVTVDENHEFFRTFDLGANNGRRRNRRHLTLLHPW